MKNFKIGLMLAIAVSALYLTGCASTSSKIEQSEQQRSAMLRWNACLERHANTSTKPSFQVIKLIRQDCEGYKRDVLDLFPPNMSSHVDQILVSSAYRHIESIESVDSIESAEDQNAEPTLMGKLIQTVLR